MEAILRRELIINKQACGVCMVFFSVMFISLGAFVRIPLPFTPVPVTLQTFFVLLSASLLGRRLGITAQASYIFLGAMGLPIFALATSGLSYFLSPTAGYIFGFLLATFLTAGYIGQAKDNLFSTALVFSAASLIILGCGSIWLKVFFGLSWAKAIMIGLLPFIPGDLLKVVAATVVYRGLKTRVKEIL